MLYSGTWPKVTWEGNTKGMMMLLGNMQLLGLAPFPWPSLSWTITIQSQQALANSNIKTSNEMLSEIE